LNSIGCRRCEIIMKVKTALSHEVKRVIDVDAWFETSNSESKVSKSNSWFFLEN
jgi:hypothetical protein